MVGSVRQAGGHEAEAVADLAAETFPLACPADMVEADIRAYIDQHLTSAHFGRHLANPGAEVLVHESDGGELIGYTLMFFDDAAVPAPALGVTVEGPAFLSKCYVRPEHHGAGISQGLLDAAVGSARRRGCGGVWLNVNYENHRAQRFYEKHGWERVGYVDFPVGERVHRDPVYQLVFGETVA